MMLAAARVCSLFAAPLLCAAASDPLNDAALVRTALSAAPSGASCGQGGVVCRSVPASGFTFDVAVAGEGGRAGDVMMLPGHPETKEMYISLMGKLAALGYRCVAVDQRGYSPGARPEDKASYSYNELAKDIFAIADAVGFGRFHMVAHDQGARVSWHAVAVSQGSQRFLSLASLSIPHADAFSDGVFGESADLQQQIAVQYVTTFVLPDSASLHDRYWFKKVKPPSFNSSEDYQRALWWYNGATDSGNMAQGPVMSVDRLRSLRNSSIDPEWLDTMIHVRELFGMAAAYPLQGVPQTVRVGRVAVPVLYICGLGDHSDLCGRPVFKRSAEYCVGGYSYLEADCGHNVLHCDRPEETDRVERAIIGFLQGHSAPAAELVV